jgi:hypothetical protein
VDACLCCRAVHCLCTSSVVPGTSFLPDPSTPYWHRVISKCSSRRELRVAICTLQWQRSHAYLMLVVTPGRLLLDLRCGVSSAAVRHCGASFHRPFRGCSAGSQRQRCGTTSAAASMAEGGTAAAVSVPTTICFATGNANKLKEVPRAVAVHEQAWPIHARTCSLLEI